MTAEKPVCAFTAHKHSWRGKYRRNLELYADGRLETRIPDQANQCTNNWRLSGIENAIPDPKDASGAQAENAADFRLILSDSSAVSFSAESEEHKRIIIEKVNEVLFNSKKLKHEKLYDVQIIDFSSAKHNGKLVLCKHGLIEYKIAQNNSHRLYYMSSIISCAVSQKLDKAIITLKNKITVVYETHQAQEIILNIQKIKSSVFKLFFKIQTTPLDDHHIHSKRLGDFSDDQCLISLTETICNVSSLSKKPEKQPRVLLCVTFTCLIERDTSTYNLLMLYDLRDLFLVIRDPNDLQHFILEFKSGTMLEYQCVHRDSFISSILDAARGVGNTQCNISSFSYSPYRYVPYQFKLDGDSESDLINNISIIKPQTTPTDFYQNLLKFVSNIPYDGLIDNREASIFKTNKTKMILAAISLLLTKCQEFNSLRKDQKELLLLSLKRLLSTSRGYSNVTKASSNINLNAFLHFITHCLTIDDDYLNYVALDCFSSLIQPNSIQVDLATEQRNKSQLINSNGPFLSTLTDVLANNLGKMNRSLLITGIVELLIYIIARPFSDTTPNQIFDTVLILICNKTRLLFKLFSYPSLAITKNSSLIFRAIIEESDTEIAKKMQELSIYEGTFLKHLHQSLFEVSKDIRVKVNRQISRELLTLWISANPKAEEVINKIFPRGLLNLLHSAEEPPKSDEKFDERNTALNYLSTEATQNKVKSAFSAIENKVDHYFRLHWQVNLREKLKISDSGSKDKTPVVLRNRKRTIKPSELNWPLFFYMFNKDHFQPDLIWNQATRSELGDILDSQLQQFEMDRKLNPDIGLSWNFREFSVSYSSLSKELKVGDYYLRPLVQFSDVNKGSNGATKDQNGSVKLGTFQVEDPNILFTELNHKYMIEKDLERRIELLKAMSYIYSLKIKKVAYYRSIMYIVNLLDTAHPRERDAIITLLMHLVTNEKNSAEIIANNGLFSLCQLIPLCHLEVDKATLPFQQNFPSLSYNSTNDPDADQNKIWYFSAGTNERDGPISFKELTGRYRSKDIDLKCKVWTQGLDVWIPISDLPQFKWGFLHTSSGYRTRMQLTLDILKILHTMSSFYPTKDEDNCLLRPMPKIKQFFTNNKIMSILVNLYLTFNPEIIDTVTDILIDICEDNTLMSQIYRSGVFFFILMYPGSNVEKIFKFIKMTHLKQAFYGSQSGDVYQKSILKNMFPEALVHYLTKYSTKRFMQIYLSNVETPEVIWNSKMRDTMINRISNHISDFMPILKENILIRYEFVQIPFIKYKNLDSELFCHGFYLKYLSQATLHRDFTIVEPVKFLMKLLLQWENELKREPNSYSLEQASQALEVQLNPDGSLPDMKILKNAYRKISRKYHPDNKTTGDPAKYMDLQTAYEFICSGDHETGPRAENLHYYIQSQIILMQRHSQDLKNYKYPGYESVFNSITRDFQSFFDKSQVSMLLVDAIKLIEETIKVSPLNSLELMRIGGLNTLANIFDKSVTTVLNQNIRDPNSSEIKMCKCILNCLSAGGHNDKFIAEIIKNKTILKNVNKMIYIEDMLDLTTALFECIAHISTQIRIQTFFFDSGVHFSLLKHMFNYDYTLVGEESNEDKTIEDNIDNENGTGNSKLDEKSEQNSNSFSNNKFESKCGGTVQDSVQLIKNNLAIAAVSALKSITSANEPNCLSTAKETFDNLLTPFLTGLIYEGEFKKALKEFTVSTRNPNMIWNDTTRNQLRDLINEQLRRIIKTGGNFDKSIGTMFKYTAHSEQIIVGSIFLRVYNEDPSFEITDPNLFLTKLIAYLTDKFQSKQLLPIKKLSAAKTSSIVSKNGLSSSFSLIDFDKPVKDVPNGSEWDSSNLVDVSKDSSKDRENIEIVCTSILNILKNAPSILPSFYKHFTLFFQLLLDNFQNNIGVIVLQILRLVFSSKESLDALSSMNCMGYILLFLAESYNASKYDSLDESLVLIQSLIGTTKLLSEMFSKGLFIYLLNIFTDKEGQYEVKVKIIEIFGMSLKNKLVGPKVTLFLPRFIPKMFVHAIEDAPDSCISLYESDHETPEMVWNSKLRDHVHIKIAEFYKNINTNQKLDIGYVFSLPDDYQIIFDPNPDAIVIAGVNLERYKSMPDYTLRNPDEFMIALVNQWNKCVETVKKNITNNSEKELAKLDLITSCAKIFFTMHRASLNLMQQTGTLKQLISLISPDRNYKGLLHSALVISESATSSEECARNLISLGIVIKLSDLLSNFNRNMLHAHQDEQIEIKNLKIISGILKNLGDHNIVELAYQIKQSILITQIMTIIGSATLNIENPAELKAILVGFLKKIAEYPTHGEELAASYDAFEIWKDYKQQDHSLYLARAELEAPLTLADSSQPKMAGYLLSNVANAGISEFDNLPPALN